MLPGYADGAAQLWALQTGAVAALDPGGGVWLSPDDGDTWQAVPPPPAGHAVQVDPTDAATVYASSTTGVLKSTDGGASWRTIFPSADGTDPLASGQLASGSADHQLLYVFTAGQLLRSPDGGATWAKGYSGFR
jgi:photosystem II stability/assembly factor-like uncharacterized protein